MSARYCEAPGCDRPGGLQFRAGADRRVAHCGPHTGWAIRRARVLRPRRCPDCHDSGTVRLIGNTVQNAARIVPCDRCR